MNVLVTGKNGQLGSELRAIEKEYDYQLIFKSSSECDITDKSILENVIKEYKIDALINGAAYTAVDQAEDNEENAFKVNCEGVKNIDELALKYGFKYIHISTDYVFNGENKEPYASDDIVSPLGVYGKSKRAGEEVVINSNSDSIVIRTSWLYSSFGNNFVKTIIKHGLQKAELNIVNDQFGSPTYARDLAKACMEIIKKDRISANGKVYQFCNTNATNWFEFTKEIFRLKSIACHLNPISTDQYPTKAQRPKYSVLSSKKIETDFSIENRNWQEALAECLTLIELKS